LVAREDALTAVSVLAEANPGETQSVIDEAHLGRMTLGDRSLEREVLEIFARQTMLTLKRITGADPARAAAAAHTLKGSACGIGAWRVVRAAERLEQAATERHDNHAIDKAIADLEAAGREVRTAIGQRLGDRVDEAAADPFGQRSREH
jgi:HPt (histidine-containing phosphotransfer) domain-containing protein